MNMDNEQLSVLERYMRTTCGYYNDAVGIESQRLPFFQQAYAALNDSLWEMAT